ncbi:MAG: hypothetical protein WAN70_15180 [Terriglobales bacterium]
MPGAENLALTFITLLQFRLHYVIRIILYQPGVLKVTVAEYHRFE